MGDKKYPIQLYAICSSLLFDLYVYFLYVFNNRLNIINYILIMSISNKYNLSI